MSLLNDALRQAESRKLQEAPVTSAIYTGRKRVTAATSKSRPRLIVLFSVVPVLAGALVWSIFQPGSPHAVASEFNPVKRLPEANTRSRPANDLQSQPRVLAESSLQPVSDRHVKESASPQPALLEREQKIREMPADSSEPAADRVKTPQTNASEVASAVPAESSTTKKQTATAPQTGDVPERPQSDPTEPGRAQRERKNSAGADNDHANFGAEPTAETSRVSPTGLVKQTHMTPAVRDQQTADAMRRALGRGKSVEARQLLDSITSAQSAPLSRARWARYQLVGNQPHRALRILPVDLVAENDQLRLLRARAQLALGNQPAALQTLQASVPSVADSPEYSITLATVLQQAGNHQAAAERWADLIAHDDRRSAWWVGLAITLENQQRAANARRAYEQALALADLQPSLYEFVRQRLQALGSNRNHD